MITKLTEEQIAKFPKYVSEWTERGLTTKALTLNEAVKDFTEFQRNVLKRDEKSITPVVLFDSPTKCWMAILAATSLQNKDVSQVRSQVWSQVESQVGSQVGSQVRSQVRSQVESQVESQVGSQVGSQVWSQVRSQEIIYPYYDCQFWASFFAFYEFIKNELGVTYKNAIEYDSFLSCQKYGMVWPLDTLCVVCQPPTIIKKNARGLHCEDGPALSYNGDNEIYSLNGVTVPKELVMTP